MARQAVDEDEPVVGPRWARGEPFRGLTLRHDDNAATVSRSRDTTRLPAFVFGSPVTTTSATTRVLATVTVPAARSTSRQRSPHSSPQRIPVASASRQSGNRRSFATEARKAPASSSVHAVIAYHPRFLDAAAIADGDRVLDVGCGTGRTTRDAARLTPSGSVLGVDLSSAMLEVARQSARADGLTNVTS